eukprot:365960-Chlamydomonas_euryale.AAC.4
MASRSSRTCRHTWAPAAEQEQEQPRRPEMPRMPTTQYTASSTKCKRHAGSVPSMWAARKVNTNRIHAKSLKTSYSTVQYSTVRYSTVQYSTVPALRLREHIMPASAGAHHACAARFCSIARTANAPPKYRPTSGIASSACGVHRRRGSVEVRVWSASCHAQHDAHISIVWSDARWRHNTRARHA